MNHGMITILIQTTLIYYWYISLCVFRGCFEVIVVGLWFPHMIARCPLAGAGFRWQAGLC